MWTINLIASVLGLTFLGPSAAMLLFGCAVVLEVVLQFLLAYPRQRNEARRRASGLQRQIVSSEQGARQRNELVWSLDMIRREGDQLVARSHGHREGDPTFEDDFSSWKARTLDWIETELGLVYAARFESEAGASGRPNGTFIDFLPQAWSLAARLSRISEFLDEVGRTQGRSAQ